jgi:site-specific DNA-methyltransferase (adenine-specific)
VPAPHTPALKPLEQWTKPSVAATRSHPALPAVACTVYNGDCRDVLATVPETSVDLIFADPPFNWNRAYDVWDDDMPREDYIKFTKQWLDGCVRVLAEHGSMWVNIPDDTAADIVVHLRDACKLHMINWCIWHYRFGQNATGKFINSKVHALYFARHRAVREKGQRMPGTSADDIAAGRYRTWNAHEILEVSDRRAIYGDPRTEEKSDGMPPGMRVPMDVWYGQFWGRIQGNNKERRGRHDNQLPEVYLERVIRACSNPGDTVLDPFLGSGTTGVVAHTLHRNFIGIEYSADNAASAIERIRKGAYRVTPERPPAQSTAIFENRRKARPARGESPE